MKRVIICESPAKKKTLTKILKRIFPGDDVQVVASFGHIRDLPRKQLGVDIHKGFLPQYEITTPKKKHVSEIRKAVKVADVVYLAADPDREGEAIAWHVLQVVKPKCQVQRVTFNAITESAVKSGFDAAGQLDMQLVKAQEARRIVDRLVGYKVSPVLWNNIAGKGLSAGRVQSVALRLIVERQRAIDAFVPRDYYSIWARFVAQHGEFDAKLVEYGGKPWDNTLFPDNQSAQKVVDAFRYVAFTVSDILQKSRDKRPSAPFTTSTLQQAASSHLGFSPDETMRLSQMLYETGLITYIRTDSVNVSPEGVGAAKNLILITFGDDYLPHRPYKFRSKGDAQEAHEAIRPTDCQVSDISQAVASHAQVAKLTRLYKLIWQRFIASQMAAARFGETLVTVTGQNPKMGKAIFQAKGRVLQFDGFLKVYAYDSDESEKKDDDGDAQSELPMIVKDESLKTQSLEARKHTTKPPPRFSEAALVKILESNGVGRPSTYAATLATIKQRGYVKISKKMLMATEIGCTVNDFLVKHFSHLVDPQFTAQMETQLDSIASGKQSQGAFLANFWSVLQPLLHVTGQPMSTGTISPLLQSNAKQQSFPKTKRNKPAPQPTGQTCPKCGKPLVNRKGKHGAFVGCSGFPKCRYTQSVS